jgi:sulfur carrier protein ThiS
VEVNKERVYGEERLTTKVNDGDKIRILFKGH